MICVGISAIFHGFALSGDLIGHARIVYGMSFLRFPSLSFIRTIGAVITILVATQTGPDWLISEETGGSIIQLMGILIAWFLAASF